MAIRVSGLSVQILVSEIAGGDPADNVFALGQSLNFVVQPSDILAVTQSLGFTDSADTPLIANLTQSLGFVDSLVVRGPVFDSYNELLTLTDSATYSFGVPWLPIEVTDSLGLSDRANRTQPISVTSNYSLSQSSFRLYTFSHGLSFSQTTAFGKGHFISQFFNLAHSVQGAGSYSRSVLHSNFIADAVTAFNVTPCVTKTNNNPPVDTKPTQLGKGLALQSLTGEQINIRSPELDDKQRTSFDRINRETLGGELNVYRDPSWPMIESLLFTVISIKTEVIEPLRQFIYNNLGKPIKLTDWVGDTWVGIITNPGEVAVEDRINGWTLAFEFEGVKSEPVLPDNYIAFGQTVSYTIV